MSRRPRRLVAQTAQLITDALRAGSKPSIIRHALKDQGISWQYGAPHRHQSKRELARRRRQLQLCVGGCGATQVTNASGVCADCLARRWRDQSGRP